MSSQKLYFGKDDAEADFTSSGLLRESFLRTDVYDRIKARVKTLGIGRKGSGKSALCLMLNRQLRNEANTNRCIVTPDAISADEIRRFEMVGVNEQQSKKLVWQYVFLRDRRERCPQCGSAAEYATGLSGKLAHFTTQSAPATQVIYSRGQG
jgi:energy-coupling factor transporter ATP-binding protein EcfA2